jgi:hypothetical protein
MAGNEPFGSGRKTVAASATVERFSSTHVPCSWLTVTAETDNTGLIILGSSAIVPTLASRIGTPLAASESVTWPIKDLYDLYIGTTVNGDGCTYTYMTE